MGTAMSHCVLGIIIYNGKRHQTTPVDSEAGVGGEG